MCNLLVSSSVSPSYVTYIELLMLLLVSGECGGYMGLLIGASVLTVCELLDLFLYNLIIKMANLRHKFRSVSDSNKCGDQEVNDKAEEQCLNIDAN